MRNKIGTIFMILGAALVLAALSLFIWNQQENKKAGKAIDEVLPQLMEQIETIAKDRENGETVNSDSSISNTNSDASVNFNANGNAGSNSEYYFAQSAPDMTKIKIDGNVYIGYLSIPALNLQLPVMSEWSYKNLRTAPCRYTGSMQTDDLVIAAHNYARHFGNLSKLSEGDEVYFTDANGILSIYNVVVVEILDPTDTVDMISGNYDLTLFTCTYGGKSRVTVRCDRA